MDGYRVERRSQINGAFEGFDDGLLFPLMDGSYWLQDEYKYWYHYSYCPEVLILNRGGRQYIQVDNQSEIVAVREISGVIESSIHGAFKGWDGHSTYELTNGQVWEQTAYKYEYKYAYRPNVLLYDPGGGYIMQVEGSSARVRRKR